MSLKSNAQSSKFVVESDALRNVIVLSAQYASGGIDHSKKVTHNNFVRGIFIAILLRWALFALRREVNLNVLRAMRQPFSASDSVSRKVEVLVGAILDAI